MILCLLAGCASDDSATSSQPNTISSITETPRTDAVITAREAALQVLLPDNDGLKVYVGAFDAEHTAVAECMQNAGFSYPEENGEDSAALYLNRVVDEGAAAVEGFGVSGPDADPRSELSDVDQVRFDEKIFGSPDDLGEVELADGTSINYPADGCLAEGRQHVYGSLEAWALATTVPEGHRYLMLVLAGNDEDYIKSVKEWQSCMKSDGYAASSMNEVKLEMRNRDRRAGRTSPSVENIRTATSATRCATRTSVSTNLEAVALRYIDGLNSQETEVLQQSWDALSNAAGR